MAEALLVTAVAVGFYLATTNPQQRGSLDYADRQTVAGWAVPISPSTGCGVKTYVPGSSSTLKCPVESLTTVVTVVPSSRVIAIEALTTRRSQGDAFTC